MKSGQPRPFDPFQHAAYISPTGILLARHWLATAVASHHCTHDQGVNSINGITPVIWIDDKFAMTLFFLYLELPAESWPSEPGRHQRT
jgi:hypothetical protein